MRNVYTRRRWIPMGVMVGAFVIWIIFFVRAAFDHLDRLSPDWTGFSRTLPFFAYVVIIIVVVGFSTTHIKVSGNTVERYHTPLPLKQRISIPVQDIEQVLFWQTGYRLITLYGLGLQTKSGRTILSQVFRTRDEVMGEVKKIADSLGSRGLTTVKVAETRTAVAGGGSINLWIVAAALAMLLGFFRLARF